MNILLIDDASSVTDAIKGRLSNIPFCKIGVANNFYHVFDNLDDKNSAYDFIISDLSMPEHGLDEIKGDDFGTVLKGWAFLQQYVLESGGKYYEKCKETKIIIFSAFRPELNQYMSDHSQKFDERTFFVEKGNANGVSGLDNLIKTITMLTKNLGR